MRSVISNLPVEWVVPILCERDLEWMVVDGLPERRMICRDLSRTEVLRVHAAAPPGIGIKHELVGFNAQRLDEFRTFFLIHPHELHSKGAHAHRKRFFDSHRGIENLRSLNAKIRVSLIEDQQRLTKAGEPDFVLWKVDSE